jgi:hypothetical protein
MWYILGKRARREYSEFNEKGKDVHLPLPRPRLVEGLGEGDKLAPPISRLTAEGIAEQKARELATKHREECERQIDAFPYRDLSTVRDRMNP